MLLLRFVSMVLLALWVGGLIALGAIGAPTIFATLDAQDQATGHRLAGAVFGAVFVRFQHLTWVIAVLLLAVLALRAALGPRPRRLGLRMWTIAAMAAMSVITAIVVSPRIDRLRESTPGTIASLPESDPRKVEFGRLHGLSNGLMIVTLVAGLGLMFAETRDSN